MGPLSVHRTLSDYAHKGGEARKAIKARKLSPDDLVKLTKGLPNMIAMEVRRFFNIMPTHADDPATYFIQYKRGHPVSPMVETVILEGIDRMGLPSRFRKVTGDIQVDAFTDTAETQARTAKEMIDHLVIHRGLDISFVAFTIDVSLLVLHAVHKNGAGLSPETYRRLVKLYERYA